MEQLAAYISAEKIIKTLCLRTGDTAMGRGALYASYLETVYNELSLDVTHQSVIRKYQINKRLNSFAIPNDCMILFAVGCEDECGVIKPLWYNLNMPKDILFENGVPCECDTCGTHSNCSTIKSFDEILETITINGTDYTKTVKTTTLTDGTVIRKVVEPILNSENEVEMVTSQNELCKLDMLPCGCVAETTENNEKVNKLCCDCSSLSTNCGTYNRFQKKEYGYSIDVTGTQISFDHTYPYDYVVLKYLKGITDARDYQIPTIALEAVISGIRYYAETDSSSAPAYDKGVGGTFYNKYFAERKKLRKRLRPMLYTRILGSMGSSQDINNRNLYLYNHNNIPYIPWNK